MIAQTNAVEQVGLRLAGNLELAALGRQRLALGILDEIGVADKGRILVALLALDLVTTIGNEFLQGHATGLRLALRPVA